MPLPYPYTFLLRRMDKPAGDASETGFVCRVDDALGTRGWSRVIQGEIPSRLSEGASAQNAENNVKHTIWERLHSGGQGANEAADFSRYQYAAGIYAGDPGEFYLQPALTQIAKISSALPAGQKIKQLLYWSIPKSIASGSITFPGSSLEVHPNGLVPASSVHYFAITSVSATGQESAASTQVTATAAGTASAFRFNWNTVATAAKYNVYHGTVSGGTKKLVGTVTGNQTFTATSGFVYRFVYDGDEKETTTLPGSASASISTIVRRVLVLADDGTTTFLYEIPYSAGVLASTVQALTVAHDTLGAVTSISGTLLSNACTVFQGRVYIPTQKDDGTQSNRVLTYDSGQVNPLQLRDITNGVNAQRYYGDGSRRLWAFVQNNAFHSADPSGNAPEWKGPLMVGSPALAINSCLVYGGTGMSDSATYVAKPDGLFRLLETEGGAGSAFERVTGLGLPDPATGSFLLEHRGELYIGAREEIFRYNLATVDSSDPNKDLGLPATLRGEAATAVSTGRHCYVLSLPAANIAASATAGWGYQQIIETDQGEAWHQVALCKTTTFSETLTPVSERWQGQCLLLAGTDVTQEQKAKLYFSGGADGSELYSMPVRLGKEKLREAAGYTPIDTGELVLPPNYEGVKAIAKIWHWIQCSQVQLTSPNLATITTSARMLKSSRPIPLTWTEIATRTSTSAGIFYDDPETFRQLISQYPAPAAGTPRLWISEGIQIKVKLGRGAGTITPVFENVLVTSGQVKNTLRRWVYIVEVSRQRGLPNRAKIYDDHDAVVAAVDALEEYAANMYPWIHTDMLGRESIVRVDVQYVQPDRTEARPNNTTLDPQIEWNKMALSVTLTELYNRKAYPGSTGNG